MKLKMYVCKRVDPIGGIDIFFQIFHSKAFLERLQTGRGQMRPRPFWLGLIIFLDVMELDIMPSHATVPLQMM